MMLRGTMVAAMLVALTIGSEAMRLYTVNEAPGEWSATRRAPGTLSFKFGVYFELRNANELRQYVEDISTPGHVQYGKGLSAEELKAWTAPSSEQAEAWVAEIRSRSDMVVEHADAHGVQVRASVAAAEALFQTELWVYRGPRDAVVLRQHGESEVPSHLPMPHAVTGLIEFPSSTAYARRLAQPSVGSGRPWWTWPGALNAHYQVPANLPQNGQSALCVVELSADHSFSFSDLSQFETGMQLPAFNVTKIVGPFNPNPSDGESTLDIQYVAGMAQGTTTWFMTVQNGFLDWATQYGQLSGAPPVVSISWGLNVANHSDPNIQSYVSASENAFAALAAARISVVVSSGDNGAPGNSNMQCQSPLPLALEPDYPGTSAYATSVGATMIENGQVTQSSSAPACSQYPCWDGQSGTPVAASKSDLCGITSGGGFSWLISQPSYQAAAVQQYMQTAQMPSAGMYNPNGRGFPDVALLGASYITYEGGWSGADGTSASTPVFASMVALINAQRLNAGKPLLGFLNPLLYGAAASAFTPVTSGNNFCTEQACCNYGYNTAQGWSAVTGLGEPNFPLLLKAALAN